MVQMCFANGTLYNVAQCEPFDLTYSYTNSQYSCVIYVYIYEQSVAAELHILNDDNVQIHCCLVMMMVNSRDFDEMLSQHPITFTKDCEDLSFVKVIGDGRK